MATNLELLLEAERRGILPPERKAVLDEARRRGLVAGAEAPKEEPSFKLGIGDLALTGRAGRIASGVDAAVRSVASGATFNLADEAAAAASGATGIGGQGEGSYAERLSAERARDAEIPAAIAIPGQVAGGVATGLGLARGGLTLLNAARPTVSGMAARGATEGAAYGAAYGFGAGEGGAENRLVSAGLGAGLGLATGGATGAAVGRLVRPKAPTTEAIKKAGSAAYKEAEKAGVVLNPASLDPVIDDIAAAAYKAGIDKGIHPKATAALGRLEEAKGQPLSLERAEILRRVLGAAAKSNDKDEARIASIMIDKLDDHIEQLAPTDVLAGDERLGAEMLSKARGLWSRARRAEVLDEMMERAEITAGANYTQSGLENALRQEFKALAKNPKRMRGFSTDEQAGIKKVAKGGPIENVVRLIGKLAPRGVVSGGFHVGVTATGGLPVALGTMAAGELARRGATALTMGNVRRASELVRGGASAVPLTPQQQALTEALIIAEGQQLPPLVQRGLEIELTDPGNRRRLSQGR